VIAVPGDVPSATAYLVAPTSLSSWFPAFTPAGPDDVVVRTGEGPALDLPATLDRIGAPGERVVVFLSAHETLTRDGDAAEVLRRRGFAVVAQSAACARIGTDKFAMKEFFDARGIPSPPWVRPGDPSWPDGRDRLLVVEHRYGTQSTGTRLAWVPDRALGPDEFGELYLDGVEYSVVAYRDRRGCAVFPPVWKGRTSPALVPPWRRLRLCPFPGLAAETDRVLRATARRVAEAAGCTGFVEVEYLVTGAGAVTVLEINPRVSGTMRISAMATGVPIFGMHRLTGLRGDLVAHRHAAEAPYAGEPFTDPAGDVVATSRITVAAPDAAGLRSRLREVAVEAAEALDAVGGRRED
jgi:hypothetical protein